MKTKEDYLQELNKKGFVVMKIHPEHIDKILEKYEETERLTAIKDDAQASYNIAKKRSSLTRDELWYMIRESYDDVMSAVREEAVGQEIDIDKGVIIFRNQKEIIKTEGHGIMKRMGIPTEIVNRIMGAINNDSNLDD